MASLRQQFSLMMQAEFSVLVDVLYSPELLFPGGKRCENKMWRFHVEVSGFSEMLQVLPYRACLWHPCFLTLLVPHDSPHRACEALKSLQMYFQNYSCDSVEICFGDFQVIIFINIYWKWNVSLGTKYHKRISLFWVLSVAIWCELLKDSSLRSLIFL